MANKMIKNHCLPFYRDNHNKTFCNDFFSGGKSHPFIDYAPPSSVLEHVLPFYKVFYQLSLNKVPAIVKTNIFQRLRIILQFLQLASSIH